MWHPEPFVKHPIPATRPPTAEEAARSRWFSPLRAGRLELRGAHLGSGHGPLARHRRRAGHARGPGLVRALRARAARGAGGRGDGHPRHPERAAAPDRRRPVHPRPDRAGAHRPRGERRTNPPLHPDHRFPPDPPPAGARAILPRVPGRSPTGTARCCRGATRPSGTRWRGCRRRSGPDYLERARAREPAVRRAGAGHRHLAAAHPRAAARAARSCSPAPRRAPSRPVSTA